MQERTAPKQQGRHFSEAVSMGSLDISYLSNLAVQLPLVMRSNTRTVTTASGINTISDRS